ncbi:MAG: hypothetical protein ACR2KB_06950 [Chitinophagaceae bacterium]
MLKRFFPLVIILLCYQVQAQEQETIELISAVTSLEEFEKEVYIYPKFTDGIVAFKNGRKSHGLFNYCLLTNEMLFVSTSNNILAIANENDVKLISIGKDTFYYNGTHFLIQAKNYGWIKTANFKSISEKGRKKIGAYGETVNGVAITLTSLPISKLFVELSSADKILLIKETRYYIGNELNEFLPLNKTNLLKLIPSDKQIAAIKYLKENKIDFTSFEQVDKLLSTI